MSTKVKIYTTPTCGYCTQAKEYLAELGIEFEAFDVTKDREAYKEMRSITGGARSVPVITVGEEVILGFERDVLDRALKKLA